MAFNIEQAAKIVPDPICDKPSSLINDKLMQIQKLKEKAKLIAMSREVNKPNKFVAK